jgi:hypothetical protein
MPNMYNFRVVISLHSFHAFFFCECTTPATPDVAILLTMLIPVAAAVAFASFETKRLTVG